MSDGTSRREFVARTLGGVAAAPLAARLSVAVSLAGRLPAAAFPAAAPAKTYLQPFDYEGVTLLEGPMKAQFDTMRAYYYAIPDDDILKGFRARAGQRARGKDLGGWYSGEPAADASGGPTATRSTPSASGSRAWRGCRRPRATPRCARRRSF